MQKINILYYEPTSGFGGSSRCLLGWLKKLNKMEYNPIVSVHYNGPAIKKIKETGIKVVDIPFKSLYIYKTFTTKSNNRVVLYLLALSDLFLFSIPTAIFLFVLIKRNRIMIAHLNSKVFGIIPGIIAAKLAGIPSICHLHDIKIPIRREKFFAKWVDCFVVLTGKAYDLYTNEYPNKRMELIQNGVDLEHYGVLVGHDKLRSEFGLKNNGKLVGIVGRLVEGKGFSDFINAARILSSKVKNIKFLIVGSASEEDKKYEIYLKKLVHDFDLGDKVIFTGWRENVEAVISILDVLVQASSTFPEGFGLTVLEAMALRKPVVVTNVPGPSEIVVNGQTGYIAPPANPEELAIAIEKIIGNNELAISMGEMGRRRADKYFNLDLTVHKIESLYQSLLN